MSSEVLTSLDTIYDDMGFITWNSLFPTYQAFKDKTKGYMIEANEDLFNLVSHRFQNEVFSNQNQGQITSRIEGIWDDILVTYKMKLSLRNHYKDDFNELLAKVNSTSKAFNATGNKNDDDKFNTDPDQFLVQANTNEVISQDLINLTNEIDQLNTVIKSSISRFGPLFTMTLLRTVTS